MVAVLRPGLIPIASPGDPEATVFTRKPLVFGGRLKRSARSSDRSCPSRPDQMDRGSSRSCFAVFIVTTKPRPSLPPLLEICLLYTSDAADERSSVDLGG